MQLQTTLGSPIGRPLDSVERDLYEFGGRDCDSVVADVLARLEG
jgi:hypothetical protein